jgi:TetR/AcrR family transcriptional repressor of nem operon
MRITKEQSAENRLSLIQAASRLFRKHGIDGVGVAEISKEAGLTHGALYAHFPSKEALAAEALSHALMRGYTAMTAPREGGERTLADYLEFYVSPMQRDNLAGGCAIAASASEIARQDTAISARFTEGFSKMVELVEHTLGAPGANTDGHQRALTIVAAMVGSIAMARATAKANPALSDDILVAVRRVLGELGGAPRQPAKRTAAKPARAAAKPARRK